MTDNRKTIVLAKDTRDILIVTPGTRHRARGVVASELLVPTGPHSKLTTGELVDLIEAVQPCFATLTAAERSEERIVRMIPTPDPDEPLTPISHAALHQELQGLADSLDTHVTTDDAILALADLTQRLGRQGLHTEDDE